MNDKSFYLEYKDVRVGEPTVNVSIDIPVAVSLYTHVFHPWISDITKSCACLFADT
jgi:hypothetical protein